MKTVKVIILDTEKESNLLIIGSNLVINYNEFTEQYIKLHNYKPQHLYFSSDDDIKEGDWTICGYNLYKWTKEDVEDCLYNPRATNNKGCQKIIATTDKSIEVYNDNGIFAMKGLPKIPESFIQDYIKSHNEGSPIAEVDVEIYGNRPLTIGNTPKSLYLRNDNSVIIHIIL
jgi:hypothetical protein